MSQSKQKSENQFSPFVGLFLLDYYLPTTNSINNFTLNIGHTNTILFFLSLLVTSITFMLRIF